MSWRDQIAKALIKAFHSSPYDFEAFSRAKIGTGEGAQVYGHGIYSAENPAVSGQGGQYWKNFTVGGRFGENELEAARILREQQFNREAAIAASQKSLDEINASLKSGTLHPSVAGNYTDPVLVESINKSLLRNRQEQHDLLTSGQPVGARTYEVGIKPGDFLDWDKSIAQQPQVWNKIPGNVRDSIDELYDTKGLNTFSDAPEAYTGKDLYNSALRHYDVQDSFPSRFNPESWDNSRQVASEFLDQEAGIPGIKYLDQQSRQRLVDLNAAQKSYDAMKKYTGGAPEWEARVNELQAQPLTSNYVVFNPEENMSILKKYGVIGAPAGALGMGAIADQSQYEAPQ